MLNKQHHCICIFLFFFIAGTCNGIPVNMGQNMIQNGDFSQGFNYWSFYTMEGGVASRSVLNQELHIQIMNGGNFNYSIMVNQGGLNIVQGISYTVSFYAYCESGYRNISVKVAKAQEPWDVLYSDYKTFILTAEKEKYVFRFTMLEPTDTEAYIEFQLGNSDSDVYLDDIKVFAYPEIELAFVDDLTLTKFVQGSHGNLIRLSLSERETLLADGSFNLHHFPDQSVVCVNRHPFRLLVVAGNATYLLEGNDIEHLSTGRKVLGPGDEFSFDNGYAGIGGAYYHGNGDNPPLIGFYHAEDHKGMGFYPPDNIIPGYYARVGAAVSYDKGQTWKKSGFVITSPKIKDYTLDENSDEKWHFSRGAGIPGLVKGKNGEYLYLIYSEFSQISQRGSQLCLARSPVFPGSGESGGFPVNPWKKYYNGEFCEPGLGGLDTPVISAQHLNESSACFPCVTYSETLDQYVIVFNIYNYKEVVWNTELRFNGIYIAFSDDCIHWTEPYLLIQDWPVPIVGKSISWQPAIIWDENSSTHGWLVYAYSENFRFWCQNSQGAPHYMAGKRINLIPLHIER